MRDRNDDTQGLTRRQFLDRAGRTVSVLAMGAVVAGVTARGVQDDSVWQIDPFKCTQCGRCSTECVKNVSAVRCVHDFSMCGYCELCFGFFRTSPHALTEGAENQMCPTGAIERTFIEDPYYQYTIDQDLCIGCARCVKGCNTFGNGSLYLQVIASECLECSECPIAAACPADAFVRVPADRRYFLKGGGPGQLGNIVREAQS